MKAILKILSLSLIFSLNAMTDPSIERNEEAVSTQQTAAPATGFSSVADIENAVQGSLSSLFPSLRAWGNDEQIAQNICTMAKQKKLRASQLTDDSEIPLVIRELNALEISLTEQISEYEKNKEACLSLGNRLVETEEKVTPEQYEQALAGLNDLLGATRVVLAQNQFDKITKRNAQKQSS